MVHNGSVGIPNIIFVSTSDDTDARVLNTESQPNKTNIVETL